MRKRVFAMILACLITMFLTACQNAAATGDGDYTFTFKNQNGVDSNCLLSGGDGMYILIVMTGDDVAGMTAIRDTFSFK